MDESLKNAAARGKNCCNTLFPGSDITGDELDFMRAMDAYKREFKRYNPTFLEVLAVLKSLGYTKHEQQIPCNPEQQDGEDSTVLRVVEGPRRLGQSNPRRRRA